MVTPGSSREFGRPSRSGLRGRGPGGAVLAACGVLVVANVAARVGPRHSTLVLGPVTALVLVVMARQSGLSYEDMGMGRRHLRRGATYAAVAIGVVAAGYLVAAAIPATRAAFLDERYQMSLEDAFVTSFIIIPVATVLPEEIAFRGVLWGLLDRRSGPATATIASSVLFGLWHILPSLRLHKVNPAVTAVVGTGWAAQAVAVTGAVLFTGLAGALMCELRRRSGSLLAPIGLHWAANGLGVVMTSVLTGRP